MCYGKQKRKKNTLAVTTKFVSCPVDTRVHTQLHAGFTKVSTHTWEKNSSLAHVFFIFLFFFLLLLFLFFFFFLYLKANSKRFTKRHIRRHTQTYTRIHAEKPSSIFTGLHRIRRLCIDSPRETRGSVKLFSIDQSERAYRNHHTGSDVTRFRDDFFPPSPTGVYVVFSFPVLLFLPLPSPCFRSYTRL